MPELESTSERRNKVSDLASLLPLSLRFEAICILSEVNKTGLIANTDSLSLFLFSLVEIVEKKIRAVTLEIDLFPTKIFEDGMFGFLSVKNVKFICMRNVRGQELVIGLVTRR